MGYDNWKTACPQHEYAPDRADVAQSFAFDHMDELDQILELCGDMDSEADEAGIDDVRAAAQCIAALAQQFYPSFKRTDRLCELRKKASARG